MIRQTWPTTIPVIPADRFVLRPARLSDVGLLDLYCANKRLAENTANLPHPLPPGATEAFVNRAMSENRDQDVWIMDGSRFDLSEVLGVISLTRMDRNQSEISYWVATAFWNTGFASCAVSALTAANPLGNATIFGSVFQDNPISARVLTGAGFEYLGDAETFSVARNAKVATWTYLKKYR